MGEGKHTPGPWFADRDGNVWRRHPAELYQNGGGVAGDQPIARATVGHFRWENKFPMEANARLIAAAPDLLEAAKLAEDIIDDFVAGGPDAKAEAALKALQAAITRATAPMQEGE